MRVSEIFAMGGGSGYGNGGNGGNEGGPVFTGTRFNARYYPERLFFKEGDDGSGFNGGFRNESFSRGRGLVGVRG